MPLTPISSRPRRYAKLMRTETMLRNFLEAMVTGKEPYTEVVEALRVIQRQRLVYEDVLDTGVVDAKAN